MVIDFFGLEKEEIRQRYPASYQWILERVKPVRDANARGSYRERWWVFGEPRALLRPTIEGLSRIIVTGETSRHRFFEFFSTDTIADNMVRVIASDDPYALGVLSSRAHTVFSVRKGGWMGVGNYPRYQAECFSTFPFPAATDTQKAIIRSLAEELDALRKRVIAEHGFLTMTKLYNVRERLDAIAAWGRSGPPKAREETSASAGILPRGTRKGDDAQQGGGGAGAPPPLTAAERAIHDAGCVAVVEELHHRIDAAVACAYNWPAGLSDEDILARLAALNKERAAEERTGFVRWLRPEYQIPRFGEARAGREAEQIEAILDRPGEDAPALPQGDAAFFAELRRMLRLIGKPAEAREIASRFRDGRRATRRVERGLKLLAATGVARRAPNGWFVADRVA